MATLERIRQRSGLLIIIIGLAMLAFILTDLLGSGQSLLRGEQNVVAVINGKTYEIKEFSKLVDARTEAYKQQSGDLGLTNVTTNQLVNAVFTELKQNELLGEQYEELGITVSTTELLDRIKQNPQVQQVPGFRDQVTGEFSETALQRYVEQISQGAAGDPEQAKQYKAWVDFEQGIKTQALLTKYTTAISKGLYTPSKMAQLDYEAKNTQRTAAFAGLLYNSIADSTIEVSESDIRNYYNANKELYKTENTRSIVYVNFPVQPSAQDRQDLMDELAKYNSPQALRNKAENKYDTLPSFAESADDSTFALQASELRERQVYYTIDELPAELDSTFFYESVGTVKGPYLAGDYMRLTKISERKMLPDSAKASHILIAYQGAERAPQTVTRTGQEALALADSLLKVVKNDPSQFDTLARTISDDAAASIEGGNVGWMNKNSGMAQPFKEFALYKENGTIGKVFTQFGIHIIKITGQEGANEAVKLTNISMELMPSETTRNDVYSAASAFASEANGAENFGEVADEKGYAARPMTNLTSSDENIIGIGNNRNIVKWAFNEETEVGDLQVFSENPDYTVVAVLTEANEEGYADPMNVKDRIEPEVIKDKKAEQLFAKLDEARSSGDNLEAMAAAMGTKVTNQGLNFAATTLTGYGNEPKVIGYICGLDQNVLSGNIKGDRGVYLANVTAVTPAPEKADFSIEKNQMTAANQQRVNTAVYPSLEKTADIEDRRSAFY
jgi:peptidyl-prolyl cis-trans isomerase D